MPNENGGRKREPAIDQDPPVGVDGMGSSLTKQVFGTGLTVWVSLIKKNPLLTFMEEGGS